MQKKTKLDQFKNECEYWLKELGLQHIETSFKKGCSENFNVECHFDPETLSAIISLTEKISKEIDLTRLALKQTLHICLRPLQGKAEKEYETVNRLTKVIYEKRYYNSMLKTRKPKKNKLHEFRELCDFWIRELGLHHIETYYERGCSKNSIAECKMDLNTLTALISLAKRIKKEVDLNRIALHEVLHMCLWPLEGDIDKEHEIINRLIYIMYK